MEKAVLPLANSVDLVEHLARERHLADDRRKLVVSKIVGDGVSIHRPDDFDRLRQRLQHCVIVQAAPVVGINPSDFLVSFVESTNFRGVLGAAGAQHVLGRGTEFLTKALEIRSNCTVIRFYVEPFDFGLVGEAERIRRIRPGDEGVGIGCLGEP